MSRGAISQVVQRLMGKPTSVEKPEEYWVARGKDVMGRATLAELLETRQADTYRAIYEAVSSRHVASLADCGCNVASLGQLLRTWGYQGEYVGVDFNEFALREAEEAMKQHGNYRFVQGNVREIPLAAGEVECVVLKDVLEHLEDFRAPLAEAARVASCWVIIANFIPWTEGRAILRKEPPGYYHNMYKRAEVYDFARQHGLVVDEVLSALEKDARANEVVVFKRANA